jgi:uncharacterized coiled-coil DUF342 family protein
MKTIDESISKRMEEARSIRMLADDYKELLPQAKGNEKVQKELDKIIGELSDKMPSLNLEMGEYAGNLDEVEKAAKDAADELRRLGEMKLALEKIKITLEIVGLQRQLRDVRKEIQDFDAEADVAIVNNAELLKTLNTWSDIEKHVYHTGAYFRSIETDMSNHYSISI